MWHKDEILISITLHAFFAGSFSISYNCIFHWYIVFFAIVNKTIVTSSLKHFFKCYKSQLKIDTHTFYVCMIKYSGILSMETQNNPFFCKSKTYAWVWWDENGLNTNPTCYMIKRHAHLSACYKPIIIWIAINLNRFSDYLQNYFADLLHAWHF